MLVRPGSASGPLLIAVTLRSTSASRSGRNTGAPVSCLILPTSLASRARSFSSATSFASSASIASRSGLRRSSSGSATAALEITHEINHHAHIFDLLEDRNELLAVMAGRHYR